LRVDIITLLAAGDRSADRAAFADKHSMASCDNPFESTA
jgi:hypothetical protein